MSYIILLYKYTCFYIYIISLTPDPPSVFLPSGPTLDLSLDTLPLQAIAQVESLQLQVEGRGWQLLTIWPRVVSVRIRGTPQLGLDGGVEVASVGYLPPLRMSGH